MGATLSHSRGDLYYHHSGRFPLSGAVVGLLVGGICAIMLGAAYSYAVLYVPYPKLSVLLCMGFGAAVGAVTTRAMAKMKVRNWLVMCAVTVAAAAIGVYSAWLFWVYALLMLWKRPLPLSEFVVNPAHLWRVIKVLNQYGVWKLSKTDKEAVNGIMLWIVWCGEAALVVGCALALVIPALAKPFCEECESWCTDKKEIGKASATNTAELIRRLEAKDFAYLPPLPAEPPAMTWCSLMLSACPGCGQTNALSVSRITLTKNKKGQVNKTSKSLMNRLVLTPQEAGALVRACQEGPAAAPIAEPPASSPPPQG
jgi:hypothetical protein